MVFELELLTSVDNHFTDSSLILRKHLTFGYLIFTSCSIISIEKRHSDQKLSPNNPISTQLEPTETQNPCPKWPSSQNDPISLWRHCGQTRSMGYFIYFLFILFQQDFMVSSWFLFRILYRFFLVYLENILLDIQNLNSE